jgi:hypothetical protein
MPFRPHLRSMKMGLALWLLVVSTSPAFAHEHEDGDRPHSHGLGLFSLSSGCGPCGQNQGRAPETRHFHLVILGIELHVPASCPWSSSEDSPLAAEQGFFQLGVEVANGLTSSGADEARVPVPSEGLPVLCLPPSVEVAAGTNRPAFYQDGCVGGCRVCDAARGLRSGAQQI